MNPIAITWQVAIILLAVLGGVSFLGYEHVVTGDFVGTIYGAIVGAVTVGHFASNASKGS